jgi:hypothetical protein
MQHGWPRRRRAEAQRFSVDRSPLSGVAELEILRLDVEGKAAAWRTLRARAERDTRLDKEQLNELLSRAARLSEVLEELRATAASWAFTRA